MIPAATPQPWDAFTGTCLASAGWPALSSIGIFLSLGVRRRAADGTIVLARAESRNPGPHTHSHRDAQLREHHLEVPKTARYFCSGAAEPDADELWVVCHGYAQLASRFLRHFEPVATGGRLIVAPEALSRFYVDSHGGHHGPDARIGATWMTREDRLAEIGDHVRYLDLLVEELTRRRGGGFPRITVLGFSQGVATVSRWLALGATRADHVIVWSGLMPSDVMTDAHRPLFGGAKLTVVVGETDPLVEPARITAELEKLDTVGIRYEVVRFGGGHELDAAVLRQLAKG